MRKGRDREKKKKGGKKTGKKEEKTEENSGHYVIVSSRLKSLKKRTQATSVSWIGQNMKRQVSAT